MKILPLVTLVLCLAVLASGQEANRREKLRNLIAAARSGDDNARQMLQKIRSKLKARQNNSPQRHQSQHQQATVLEEPQPVQLQQRSRRLQQRPRRIQQQQQQQQRQQQQQEQQQQQPQPQEQPIEEPQQQVNQFEESLALSRRERIRSQADQRSRSLLDPHRALNRGLEIDTRSEKHANIRVTNQTKTPPVETIRRFSYFDEEGNYIFGYEAADGSFKEEKRGLDCIVHGKYGYVDPDGVRREFTYVSGNRCDPNAPSDPTLQDSQSSLPPNDQFLMQTQEKKLDEAALKNRRRFPVAQELPQRQPQFRAPEIRPLPRPQPKPEVRAFPEPQQQQVRTAPRRQRPQRVQTQSRRPHERTQTSEKNNQVTVQEETFVESVPHQDNLEPKPVIPLPAPKAPKAPKASISHFQQPSLFRPTPKPLDARFNFEQEFQNIFNNFANSRPPVLQQRTHSLPTPRPPPPPPQPRPTPAPALRKLAEPQPKPAPSFPPKVEKPVVPHQLVFDAATGTFKTVPLNNLVSAGPIQRGPPPPPPPPPAFKSAPKPPAPRAPVPAPAPVPTPAPAPTHATGRPLPLPGFNPLPPVPLGSLTFGGSNTNFGQNFHNFFSVKP